MEPKQLKATLGISLVTKNIHYILGKYNSQPEKKNGIHTLTTFTIALELFEEQFTQDNLYKINITTTL